MIPIRLARIIQIVILTVATAMYVISFYDWTQSDDYQEFIRK